MSILFVGSTFVVTVAARLFVLVARSAILTLSPILAGLTRNSNTSQSLCYFEFPAERGEVKKLRFDELVSRVPAVGFAADKF